MSGVFMFYYVLVFNNGYYTNNCFWDAPPIARRTIVRIVLDLCLFEQQLFNLAATLRR